MSHFFDPADYLSEDPATVSEREAKRLWYDARQRAKLCRAMVRVTARRGYAGASVHDALRVAGYGKAAYYRHYENRESCLLEAFERCAATLLGSVSAAVDAEDGVANRIESALQALVAQLEDKPAVARVMLVEIRVAQGCREAQQHWFERFAELLRRCLSVDAPEMDGELARLLAGSVLERLTSSLREESGSHLSEVLPDLVFIALAPCVGVEAAMKEMDRHREDVPRRRAPKPRAINRSKEGVKSSKEMLRTQVETLSEEEAARARLVIEED